MSTRLRRVWVAEWFALQTADHAVPGSYPTGGGIQLRTVKGFIIGLDKSGYQVNNFLISQRKHVVGTH